MKANLCAELSDTGCFEKNSTPRQYTHSFIGLRLYITNYGSQSISYGVEVSKQLPTGQMSPLLPAFPALLMRLVRTDFINRWFLSSAGHIAVFISPPQLAHVVQTGHLFAKRNF